MKEQVIKVFYQSHVILEKTLFEILEDAGYKDHHIASIIDKAADEIIAEFKLKMPSEEEIKESNPYPEDVFIPISDGKLKEVAYHLRLYGYSADALFGHWGRIVWNNCCEWFRNRMGGEL